MNWFQGCEWQHYRTTLQVCRWFLPKTFVSGPTLTGRDESSCLLEEGGGGCSRQFKAHFKFAKRVSKRIENILVSFFVSAINVSVIQSYPILFVGNKLPLKRLRKSSPKGPAILLSPQFLTYSKSKRSFGHCYALKPSLEDDGRRKKHMETQYCTKDMTSLQFIIFIEST